MKGALTFKAWGSLACSTGDSEGVLGPEQIGVDAIVVHLDVLDDATRDVRVVFPGVGCVVTEGSVRVREIGGSQSGDRLGSGLVDREVGRDLGDPGRDATLGEIGPEGFALAQADGTAPLDREADAAEVDRDVRRRVLENREHGGVGLGVADRKISHTVAPRAHSGDK